MKSVNLWLFLFYTWLSLSILRANLVAWNNLISSEHCSNNLILCDINSIQRDINLTWILLDFHMPCLEEVQPCHAKTGHYTLVIVIPKEDLVGPSLTKPSLGMISTIQLCSGWYFLKNATWRWQWAHCSRATYGLLGYTALRFANVTWITV